MAFYAVSAQMKETMLIIYILCKPSVILHKLLAVLDSDCGAKEPNFVSRKRRNMGFGGRHWVGLELHL